jgi:putative endonuclease
VLDRNWRVREGELDLVVRDARTIAFCEVKTRRGDAFGLPVEAVTARKRQRLRLLAGRWLDAHDASAGSLRFDVASVRPDGRGGWDVEMLANAF